ncbi:MAG: hypothetical protein ACE5IO_02680, partial [Thermoplasmata archaeon]
MRKLVSLCFLALFAMVCSFFLPFASAEQTTVSYSIRTEDMFPIIERVDLILQTEWNVDFNADDGSVGPGETVEYPITASPALGSISVEWWYNGTVLTGHNSQTVPHQTP